MTPEAHPIEKEQVMEYLDGEFILDDANRVATHLEQCAECRELAENLRGVSSQMLTWSIEPVSKRMSETVMTALAGSGTQQTDIHWRRKLPRKIAWHDLLQNRWTWVAAATVAVGVCIFSVSPNLFVRQKTPSAMMAYRNAQMDTNLINTEKLEDLKERQTPSGPMIARTASLKISVKDFGAARAAMDKIVSSHQGYASTLNISTENGAPQSLEAKLAIPAAQCDAVLAELKGIGHVEQERQGGEEVTAQVVDLDARLKNARETEARLTDVLRTRTGKVGDVLEVEKEMARVREEIEQMEAKQKQLSNRVAFASVDLTLTEQYQAQLGSDPSSAGRQIRNALVDGYHEAADGLLGACVFLLSIGPSLIVWTLILFFPGRWAWRRWRKSHVNGTACL